MQATAPAPVQTQVPPQDIPQAPAHDLHTIQEVPSLSRRAFDVAAGVLTDPRFHEAAKVVGLAALEGANIIFEDSKGKTIVNRGEITLALDKPKKTAEAMAKASAKPAAAQALAYMTGRYIAGQPKKSHKK